MGLSCSEFINELLMRDTSGIAALCYLLCKGYIRPSAVTYLPCKGYLNGDTPSIDLAISTLIVAVPTFRYPSQSRYITAHAPKYPSQPRYPLYGEPIDVEAQKILIGGVLRRFQECGRVPNLYQTSTKTAFAGKQKSAGTQGFQRFSWQSPVVPPERVELSLSD